VVTSSALLMRIAAGLTFLLLLGTAFRSGWTTPTTDFPNYYTGARLVRQGQPLRAFYDWTWFARQMNYAGNGTQLGAYIPQTPLTMLPIVAFAELPPQNAKRVWLLCNLVFLIATVWLLSSTTRFTFERVWILTMCGYFSLRTNFIDGQYYVFLLFLLTLAFYFLNRNKQWAAGAFTGIAFALKLYGGPFFLFFIAKRLWKAFGSLIVATLLLLSLAILLFGPGDIHYYATQILPRSLEGGSLDPYDPATPTLSNLLRHTFVTEAELNPHPLVPAPWAFFFLRPFLSGSIVAFLFFGTNSKRSSLQHDFGWFVIAIVLLSTSTASYTFIVLLLPLILLLDEAGPGEQVVLMAMYVLLTLPLHPLWLFPKVWLLFALFLFVGGSSLWQLPRGLAAGAVTLIGLFSFIDARRQMVSYTQEPAQRFEHTVIQEGSALSAYPVVSRAGLFYQFMGKDRYVLRWLHDNRIQELSFAGHALHPRPAADGEFIDFELVANRTSTMMRFDPSTRMVVALNVVVPPDRAALAASPDGKWLAFESDQNGPTQIVLKYVSSGEKVLLTGGHCNNTAPTWELDSHAIIFASDCGRGNGLPALYSARVPSRK
jgi:hypothetical protein